LLLQRVNPGDQRGKMIGDFPRVTPSAVLDPACIDEQNDNGDDGAESKKIHSIAGSVVKKD
jgi:hypothetical protein